MPRQTLLLLITLLASGLELPVFTTARSWWEPRVVLAGTQGDATRPARSGAFRMGTSAWSPRRPLAETRLRPPPPPQSRGSEGKSRLHVYNRNLVPHWIGDGSRFWYRRELPSGGSWFVVIDAAEGSSAPAFDHDRLAAAFTSATGHAIQSDHLPIDQIEWEDNGTLQLGGTEGSWRLDPSTYTLTPAETTSALGLPFTRTPRPSVQSGPESEITFVNRLDEPVRIYWLDGSASRNLYSTLEPGARYAQHTFAGHVWLVLGADDAVLAVFEAVNHPELAVIDGREPTTAIDEVATPQAYGGPGTPSPDGRWAAFSRADNLWLLDLATGAERRLSTDGSATFTYAKTNQRERSLELEYDAATPPAGAVDIGWSPDSRHLIALRSQLVPEKDVYVVESSPGDQVQPRLLSYPYLKAGDEIPIRWPRLFDVESGRETPLDTQLYPDPWGLYLFRWTPEGDRCFFLYNQRGHAAMRVIEIEAATGRTRALVEERSETFVDYSSKSFLEQLDDTDELIWMSERDGWNHLYLYDRKRGAVKNQITRGDWAVRGVDRVDPGSRRIWFRAVGLFPDEDPYFIHHCRVDFDGGGFVVLTRPEGEPSGGDGWPNRPKRRDHGRPSDQGSSIPRESGARPTGGAGTLRTAEASIWRAESPAVGGTHEIQWSPDGRYFIDTRSRVDLPPVHVLRNGDGGVLICELEEADASEFLQAGRAFPEPFVAPGRDGLTPIYGVIHRPYDFDPMRRYPVIENIYAGPHDQHVPKSFRPTYSLQTLANRGFIVVQIDGMGTNWRSREFHDVCWQNLVDAGLPDRIAWIRAAADRYAYMDTTRVGIYGVSAGGQNALGALLTHGDFYKVAVADCGCHDNRMDKAWWNEQWMGYPVGPHYESQSNVTLAPNLEGDVLLIVGELDRNVDPASTLQVVDALIEADKDFDMLVIPGAGHGAAGTEYGRRRLEEYFVKHLADR